jgi:hypothetical protein
MNRSDCPDFDDLDYEKILTWAKAEVVYDDVFVNGKGEKTVRPERGYWTMFWEHGFIGFNTISKEDEAVARMAAAMFIYLWCHGIMASVADSLAALYARAHNYVPTTKHSEATPEKATPTTKADGGT